MLLSLQSHALRRGESSVVGEHPAPQSPHHPPPPSQLEPRSPHTPGLDDVYHSRRYVQLAQGLPSSSPSTCRWLGPGELKIVSEHPIAAGGFSNVWEGTHDGRKVVLKSYRCYVSFDVANVVSRFLNEAHMWALLHQQGMDVVPLVGVHSTEDHPFGLVYEYKDGLDLRQHLRNEPNMGRLELLMGIAQGLNRMHDLGVVHGSLDSTNILVDKDNNACIAGLGNAAVLHRSTTCTAEGGTSTTEAEDMHAFGVLAWEILTGQSPFFGMTEIAAMHSMLNGIRPPRPADRRISDRIWFMIERCWHNVPSKRMSAREAVNLLETELGWIPGSRPIPCAE